MSEKAELGPEEVAERLRDVRMIADVHRDPTEGGLPTDPGVYAWWMTPGCIPGVKGPAHPVEPVELLYVGIAPKDGRSSATMRSRIRRQHLGGNIGSSTFRQSLAALLLETQKWEVRRSGSRPRLVREHNRALSEWQHDRLRLGWVERPQPWAVEECVIARMGPPLNLAGNASNPLYHRLKGLRAKLREGTGDS